MLGIDIFVLCINHVLGELKDFVGGPEYIYKLLDPLGGLCTAEETSVRDMVCLNAV